MSGISTIEDQLALREPIVRLVDIIPEALVVELPKTKFVTYLSSRLNDRCYKCNRTYCSRDPYGIYKDLKLVTIQCRLCNSTLAVVNA